MNIPKINDKLFSIILNNNLIYNSSWEDSDIDRKLLSLSNNSKLLTITSAGCNVLNYLLDNPHSIHTVDINPRQTALLELKIKLIKYTNYDELWNFFGLGSSINYIEIYNSIKNYLSPTSQVIWDKKIEYFDPNNKYNFFYRGSAGRFARLILNHINRNINLQSLIHNFKNSQDLQTQSNLYNEIEPKLWDSLTIFLLKRKFIKNMIGVPNIQFKNYSGPNQLIDFIKTNLNHTFKHIPINTNYFWKSYLNGKFSKNSCPPYLKESNFQLLKNNIDKISFSTESITNHLKSTKNKYTHFNLLDHLDWLANNKKNQIEEEFNLIINNSELNSKILFRSISENRSFIPDTVLERINFQDKTTSELHLSDKVGTYASTNLGIIK